MKRTVVFLFTVMLAVSVFAVGASAVPPPAPNFTSINTGAGVAPFMQTSINAGNIAAPVELLLNPALFEFPALDESSAGLNVSNVNLDDLALLSVVADNPAAFAADFTQAFSLVISEPPAAAAVIGVRLTLTPVQGAFNKSANYNLRIAYNNNAFVTADALAFSGVITARSGSLSGFSAQAFNVSTPWQINAGSAGNFKLPLQSSYFTFTGNAGTDIDAAKLAAHGVAASSGNPNFSAGLSGTEIQIECINPNVIALGNFNLPVTLSMTNSAASVQTATINLPVKVSPSLNPGQSLVLDTSNLVNLGNGIQKLTDNILKLRIPYSAFNAAGSNAADLAGYLNSNHKGWIATSPAIGNDGKNFSAVNISGTDYIVIELTVPNTGIISGLAVSLNANNTASASNIPGKIAPFNTATPIFLGVASNAAKNPNSPPATLIVGNTLTYVLSLSDFNWSNGAAVTQNFEGLLRGNYTINMGSYSTYFNDPVITYDAALGSTVLRLTAKTPVAFSGAGTFILTDTVAPAPNTLSFNVPAITIANNNITTVGNTITGVAPGAYLGKTFDGKEFYGGALEDMEVYPGGEIYLYYDSDFFTWQNGAPVPAVPVTNAMLNSGGISVRSDKSTGSQYIEDVETVYSGGKSFVRIRFADSLSGTNDKKFKLTVYFRDRSGRHSDSQVLLSGIFCNPAIELYSGDDYVDMTEYPIIYTRDAIRNAELYIGNGLTIYTNLSRSRRYYAASNDWITDEDEKIFSRYGGVDTVYNLDTTNFPASAKVGFGENRRDIYVYDENGRYLGTTADKVELLPKYYLSSKRVNMNIGNSGNTVVEEEYESSSAAPVAPPTNPSPGSPAPGASSGGSGGYQNYNPPTGYCR